MKRKCIIQPSISVNASASVRFNKPQAQRLLDSLKDVYNQLDAMGYDTYSAVGGEQMQDDIDTYLRQVDTLLRGN